MNIIRRRKRNAHDKLNIFWDKRRKEFSIDNLITIANPVQTDDFRIRENALKEFLTRRDKVFDEFNRILNAARDVLEKDEQLKKQFWDQLFSIRSVDIFAELIYAGEAVAAERFKQDVKSGAIIPKLAKRVWISLFMKFTDETSRNSLWNKIKQLNPDDKEIQSLFDLFVEKKKEKQEIMRSLPKISAEATKILNQNRKKRDKRAKLLNELKNLINNAAKEKSAKQKQE